MKKLELTAIRLPPDDLRALARLAAKESELVGTRVTPAAIVRRLIREHLRRTEAARRVQGHVP
jgi:hypothetical protein